MCVKVIRTRNRHSLALIKKVRCSSNYVICIECPSHQIYHRVTWRARLIAHPNVLPVIKLLEPSYPLCIVTPWMPDGNIAEYIQMNPSADRLMLVRTH